jgi:hypothetical protein
MLGQIAELGLDGIAGARWAMDMQESICPTVTHKEYWGQYQEKLGRPGYLFKEGVCVDNRSVTDKVLIVVEAVLKGQQVYATFGTKGYNYYTGQYSQQYETIINPMALINSHVADLKSLDPQYNDCNKVESVADKTLGGLFPKGEANSALKADSQCNE